MADPYPWYQLLRDESPCHFVPKRNLYVVSRYEDVIACTRNHKVFSSTGGVGFDWQQRPMMPMYDPPEHSRLRRLVSPYFTPRTVDALGENVRIQTRKLFEDFVSTGECELIRDIAVPLSLGLIADLYGMPEVDRGDLRRWSQGIVEQLAGGLPPDEFDRVDALRREFVRYLKRMIAERRASPSNGSDVLSCILAANDEDALTDREVLAFGVVLLTAGFETTVNAIANGVLAFMRHPDQWHRLLAEPELMPSAIEEVIRYDGAVQSFFRNTLEDTEVAGTPIPKGVKVQLLFASANRDERAFERPETFRIDRFQTRKPTSHVGYGTGIHYCLGAPLARVELTAFFTELARHARSFELAGDVVPAQSVLFRGAKRLPLRMHPKAPRSNSPRLSVRTAG